MSADNDHDHDPALEPTAEEYETRHVHAVYEEIATHFSSTRYKPWPIVAAFLESLPAGSIGLDVGCGNGKYLGVNPEIWLLGSDRSESLARIAASSTTPSYGRNSGISDAIVADGLELPHQASRFDFAISIAVVHHLSTTARRVEALRALLETLRPSSSLSSPSSSTITTQDVGGRALVFVWALEQKGSRRGWGEGDEQDVMVPWVMKEGKREREKHVVNRDGAGTAAGNDSVPTGEAESVRTFQRYYHLYRRGELEADIVAAGGRVLESGYERDNWWAIASRETETDLGAIVGKSDD